MHPLTLTFPPELEWEFWDRYTRDSMPFVRGMLALGIVIYAVFCVWDWNLFPDDYGRLWSIRLGVVVPSLAAAIAATYFERTRRSWQVTSGLALFVAILGLALMMPVVPRAQAETHFHPGVQMAMIFSFAALRLRFVYATLFSLASVVAYFMVAIGWVGFSTPALPSSAFFLLGTIAIGMLTSWLLERYARRDFLLQRENEKLLARVEEEKVNAEAANAAKTRFLAAASHDLRQPLHTIGLLVDALRERQDEPRSRRIADRTLAAVDAMENLFNGLLDVSRLDAGMVTPSPIAIPIAALFETLAARFRPQASERGLALRFRATSAVVDSDPVLLERILGNLIENGLRYTQAGGVLVACRRRGPGFRIEVHDTGPGIPDADQERIFEEFFQLSNPERDRTKGLGLGLAIVKRTAALLGHSIRVRSRIGRGTTFLLEVPAAGGLQAEVSAVALFEDTRHDLRGLFVLVIDDEESIRDATALALETGAARTLCAASGAEAVSALAAHLREPDLILCDYRLRDHETGLEAIAQVREACGGPIPAVVVTGDIGAADLARVRDAGIPLVHKPIGGARLRSLVRESVRPPAESA